MVKCGNNAVSDVSVIRSAHQNSANQKSAQSKLRPENINFVYGFSPVYYISRVFGLMPFSIICDHRRGIYKPQVKLLDGVWFLLSIFMYISMAIATYVNLSLPRDTNTASFILSLGDSMLLIVGLIYSALIIVFDMLNRQRLTEILNKFITFDKEVRTHSTFNSIQLVSVRNTFFSDLLLRDLLRLSKGISKYNDILPHTDRSEFVLRCHIVSCSSSCSPAFKLIWQTQFLWILCH